MQASVLHERGTDQLSTRRYGLDEANEAFRALAAGELARGLIVF